MLQATYVLPIRYKVPAGVDQLTDYLCWLATYLQVVIVDGSPPDVFAAHAARWNSFACHIAPDPDLLTPNGKVGGVLTGLRHAGYERVVLADDDVRYDLDGLRRVITLLDRYDVVRPQNYFAPQPWHVRWDTARTLLNRVSGGDWPGTLGVRRSTLLAAGGYAGDVLFENLELVRTVLAAGGRQVIPLDLFVRRLPPNTRHFWSQRVRQAYDEFARPVRLAVWLTCLPLALWLAARRRWQTLLSGAVLLMGMAEIGRWRAGGRQVFPPSATLFAPLWVMERALCSWLAVAARLFLGGIPYHGKILTRAATRSRPLSQGSAAAPGRRTVHAIGIHLAQDQLNQGIRAQTERDDLR